MSISPANFARVSNLQRTRQVGDAVTSTQRDLLAAQREVSTGRRVVTPSDDPSSAVLSQQVRKTLERREAYAANLDQSVLQLSQVDNTLGGLADLLREAQQIASANVGSDAPPAQRKGAAEVVQSIYRQALTLANDHRDGAYLFAGDRIDAPPFVENSGADGNGQVGGVRYVGGDRQLETRVADRTLAQFQVDGAAAFGAVSGRVRGSADLTPTATADTRLADLGGATGRGAMAGVVRLSDGATSTVIDLSSADSLGDVADRLTAAGVGGIVATLTADGLRLDGAATISLTDVGGGSTTADLGLTGGGGASVVGDPVRPRLTPLTTLASLRGGAGIDPAGFVVTNGAATQTIDPTTLTTVQDLLNAVNGSPTGARAEIDAGGRAINLLNPVQGPRLTVGENGGATAGDLGIRSFSPDSPLGQLNDGRGVRLADGAADLRVTDSNGVSADVDLNGAATAQDAIDAINAALTAAGAGATASFAATGNGLVLTDTAGGPGAIAATSINGSAAAADLGLDGDAVGGAIAGRDVNAVEANGVFAHLAALRDALSANDSGGITRAAEGLDVDLTRAIDTRGAAGARVKEFEARRERLDDQTLASQKVLSDLEDADFEESILKFNSLQTALQASLQTGSKVLNLSLMDFLN